MSRNRLDEIYHRAWTDLLVVGIALVILFGLFLGLWLALGFR